jgi:succinate-acetate transporter protein
MKLLIVFASVLIWVIGTIGAYRICRLMGEDSELADAAGSFLFWWLIFPLFMCGIAWKAGAALYERVTQERPALRAGADNGLYD